MAFSRVLEMWIRTITGYFSIHLALVTLLSIAMPLFLERPVALSQENNPAYLTPPGNEYPQPAPGAQPPIIYNPYDWDFESREILELYKDKSPVEKHEGKKEEEEEVESNEAKSLGKPSVHYWYVKEPDSNEPDGERTPLPPDSQELGEGSWVRP